MLWKAAWCIVMQSQTTASEVPVLWNWRQRNEDDLLFSFQALSPWTTLPQLTLRSQMLNRPGFYLSTVSVQKMTLRQLQQQLSLFSCSCPAHTIAAGHHTVEQLMHRCMWIKVDLDHKCVEMTERWQFKSGQLEMGRKNVYLQTVDNLWHPSSLMECPRSLNVYITTAVISQKQQWQVQQLTVIITGVKLC